MKTLILLLALSAFTGISPVDKECWECPPSDPCESWFHQECTTYRSLNYCIQRGNREVWVQTPYTIYCPEGVYYPSEADTDTR